MRAFYDSSGFRQLPELLYFMEELRSLVVRYVQVIQRYYVQYLSDYDAIALNELAQNLPGLSEDISDILSAFCNALSEISLDRIGWQCHCYCCQLFNCYDFAVFVTDQQESAYDFRGLRLDWCRLQVS